MHLRRTFAMAAVAALALVVLAAPAFAIVSHGNGGTQMPAYYDHNLFTITFMELSPKAEAATIAHNRQTNLIYQSDDFPAFVSVINAIPADGMNPLWREVQIHWNVTPYQLYSDDAILAAAAAGKITLETTNEMYICAVVGRKH